MYLMIVSDVDNTVDALTDAFVGSGFILSFARSAEEALAQLAGREAFYDWVIADSELPDLSGLELGRHVLDMSASICVALVSDDPGMKLPDEVAGMRIFGPARTDWNGQDFGAMFANGAA